MNTQDDQGGAHALKRIRAVGFDENYEFTILYVHMLIYIKNM